MPAEGHPASSKTLLMAVHERAFHSKGRPYASILLFSQARFQDGQARAVMQDAANKLWIQKLVWL